MNMLEKAVVSSDTTLDTSILFWMFKRFQKLHVFRDVNWRRVSLVIRENNHENDPAGTTTRISPGHYIVEIFLIDTRDDVNKQDITFRHATTLLHEMAHVATWNGRVKHDRHWRAKYVLALKEYVGVDDLSREVKDEIDFFSDVSVDVALDVFVVNMLVRHGLGISMRKSILKAFLSAKKLFSRKT